MTRPTRAGYSAHPVHDASSGPIKNDIDRRQKLYFIKQAHHHLFGTDFEARDNMLDDEAVCRFDEVWETQIKDAVLKGDPIEYEEALILRNRSGSRCRREQKHRKFELADTVFVAQLEQQADVYSHNQYGL